MTATVSLAPLVILTAINYRQYQRTLREEVRDRVDHLTSLTKRSLEFFLSERRAALHYIAAANSREALSDQDKLEAVFGHLKEAIGGIIDLGFIDSDGRQVAYVGPYPLRGMDYSDQDWLHETVARGHYTSDVFTGYRKVPHFVMAVVHGADNGNPCVLRATLDSQVMIQQLRALETSPPSDAFLVNEAGILQTPSTCHGGLLAESPIPPPPYSDRWEVEEKTDAKGDLFLLGYAHVRDSPFILILVKYPSASAQRWFSMGASLWCFLLGSVLLILLLIMGTSYYLISRIREADEQRAQIAHNVEYTNKMASIGRLAAGVAHEINNPLAIINEKAGMISDLVELDDSFPRKDKIVELVRSITASVERGSRITRRLLGFAKHIDINIETIDLKSFTEEVLGFLEHEASYRNIVVDLRAPPGLPSIRSDRGQLQQVFLNILNNSLNALSETGRAGWVRVCLSHSDDGRVTITFTDNGPGIPDDLIKHIFEPFFTTRSQGAGLGLSITYGIVEKLGGTIRVNSVVGKGTSFIVTLPVVPPSTRGAE